jgi:3-oxoacyl-[acyl-carrier-protein] synthase II
MNTFKPTQLSSRQVLVSVGTLCGVSAVGTTETHRALVTGDPNMIGLAALDAGLVKVSEATSALANPTFTIADGKDRGRPVSLDEIESRWGTRLRDAMGVRVLGSDFLAPHILSDVGAPLPHDLENGGLRRLAGLTFLDIRGSSHSEMFGLFDDDPRLGPSLQSQLFLYGGLGALAALPTPLSQLLEPERFRVAAGCAFPGLDSLDAMTAGMQPGCQGGHPVDRLVNRLAASLNTHGPALISAMLSPTFALSKVKRNTALLDELAGPRGLRRVPQAPLVSSAACASALLSLCEIASQLVGSVPGACLPQLVLLTAADAALRPDGRVLEGFGSGGALVSQEKVRALNATRPLDQWRTIKECICPFDADAQGTAIGHAGSGIIITTLDFALRNFLDVTSLIVGWGQSGETGGKGHFAGVGFGGENAMILALRMASLAHGYGVEDFRYLVAHATGTRTNSRTDLTFANEALRVASAAQEFSGRLPRMVVGTPKAVGDGHSMGETGLKALGEAIQYVLGLRVVGVPNLRRIDEQLSGLEERFVLSPSPVAGDEDGGAFVFTQGFGGYNGAVAVRSATPHSLSRYDIDPGVLQAYLERWPELRRLRQERETRLRRTRGFPRRMAEEHAWSAATKPLSR